MINIGQHGACWWACTPRSCGSLSVWHQPCLPTGSQDAESEPAQAKTYRVAWLVSSCAQVLIEFLWSATLSLLCQSTVWLLIQSLTLQAAPCFCRHQALTGQRLHSLSQCCKCYMVSHDLCCVESAWCCRPAQQEAGSGRLQPYFMLGLGAQLQPPARLWRAAIAAHRARKRMRG